MACKGSSSQVAHCYASIKCPGHLLYFLYIRGHLFEGGVQKIEVFIEFLYFPFLACICTYRVYKNILIYITLRWGI